MAALLTVVAEDVAGGTWSDNCNRFGGVDGLIGSISMVRIGRGHAGSTGGVGGVSVVAAWALIVAVMESLSLIGWLQTSC